MFDKGLQLTIFLLLTAGSKARQQEVVQQLLIEHLAPITIRLEDSEPMREVLQSLSSGMLSGERGGSSRARPSLARKGRNVSE